MDQESMLCTFNDWGLLRNCGIYNVFCSQLPGISSMYCMAHPLLESGEKLLKMFKADHLNSDSLDYRETKRTIPLLRSHNNKKGTK